MGEAIQCRMCGEPATEVREYSKSLIIGGEAVSTHKEDRHYCYRHATEYDAQLLGQRAAATLGAPPPPTPRTGLSAYAPLPLLTEEGTVDLPAMERRAQAAGLRLVSREEDGVLSYFLADADSCPEIARDSPAARIIERALHGPDEPPNGPEAGGTPLVRGIALDDATSRDLAGTWERVIGLCAIAAMIPTADVRALLREYDRTDALMPSVDPAGYREMRGNMAQHREIAEAFLAFREAMGRQTGGE